MKIIVCPDSFKGSLSANEAADIIADSIASLIPDAQIIKIPLGDGGEGTSSILKENLKMEIQFCQAHDAMMNPVETKYLIDKSKKIAFIESAEVIGLEKINIENRNPMLASSYGLGEVITDAIKMGCTDISVSLGGSATCDGGMGMLNALGYRFFDKESNILKGNGEETGYINRIEASERESILSKIKFTAVCDVTNPLYGKSGAAYVYAPQKGANPIQVEILDEGLKNLYDKSVDYKLVAEGSADFTGSGAAGGLGFALMTYLKASYKSGIDFCLEKLNFEEKISDADLIITGEGRLDGQSLMGKVLNGVLKQAGKYNIPLIAVGGSCKDYDLLKAAGVKEIFSISNKTLSLVENMQPEIAAQNLKNTIKKYFHIYL